MANIYLSIYLSIDRISIAGYLQTQLNLNHDVRRTLSLSTVHAKIQSFTAASDRAVMCPRWLSSVAASPVALHRGWGICELTQAAVSLGRLWR